MFTGLCPAVASSEPARLGYSVINPFMVLCHGLGALHAQQPLGRRVEFDLPSLHICERGQMGRLRRPVPDQHIPFWRLSRTLRGGHLKSF